MNAIDALFQRLRREGRKAFIPFVTAGDPDLDTTEVLIHELVRRGADLVEVGFPYSDPIADGSVIQASYTRALSRGLRIEDIFAHIGPVSEELPVEESEADKPFDTGIQCEKCGAAMEVKVGPRGSFLGCT